MNHTGLRFGATYHIRLDQETAGSLREKLATESNDEGYWRFYDPQRVEDLFIRSLPQKLQEEQAAMPAFPENASTATVRMKPDQPVLTIETRQHAHERDTDRILLKAVLSQLQETMGLPDKVLDAVMGWFPGQQSDPASIFIEPVVLPASLLADPNREKPVYGSTAPALIASIAREEYDLANALLQHPAINVNATDEYGHTALMYAVDNGNLDMMEALLTHPDINVNIEDRSGYTALVRAAMKKDAAYVKRLLAQPGINVKPSSFEALRWAVERDNAETVAALVAHPELDVNATGRNGEAVLRIAANRYQPPATIQALLQHPDIDVNTQNRDHGNTALMWAARRGHVEAVRDLLKHPKINTRLTDSKGNTALDIAKRQAKKHFYRGKRREIVKLLKAHQ